MDDIENIKLKLLHNIDEIEIVCNVVLADIRDILEKARLVAARIKEYDCYFSFILSECKELREKLEKKKKEEKHDIQKNDS